MSEEATTAAPAGEEEPVKFDARLAEGVAYFEQMLEIMPDDRTTLEFLVVAYDMLGEHEKGQKSLVSLTELLVKEHDIEALKGLLPRLENSDYPPAKALSLKVSTLTAPAPDLTPERPKELTETEKTAIAAQNAVVAEQSVLNLLKDAGVITESEERQFSDHLVAPTVDGRIFLISALHILKNENATLHDKCMEYLADHFNAPPVPLAAFEPPASYFKPYPELTMRLRGAVPFAKIGNITLIAVLNPADQELKAALEAVGPCRFYMADPSAVEAALERVFGTSGGGGGAR
jgi:hypothetical protein